MITSYQEELIPQIPAARLLVALGYQYLDPALDSAFYDWRDNPGWMRRQFPAGASRQPTEQDAPWSVCSTPNACLKSVTSTWSSMAASRKAAGSNSNPTRPDSTAGSTVTPPT